MTTKRTPTATRGSRKAQRVGKYHDRYRLLHEDFRRECLPYLDLDNTADAQIAELTQDVVTCLKMLRIELDGYDPKGERS